MKKNGILFIMLLFSITSVFAQSSANYTFTTFTNGSLLQDMNGNTVDMSSGTTLLIDYGNDDVQTSIYPIGFEFLLLYGTNGAFYRHTTFSVTSNGLMRLGEYNQGNRYNIAQDEAYGLISPLVRNLATHSTGKVHYKLVGSAPNRCLVVEWKNMEVDNASTTADATYQARLYETTGIVEFVYGSMNVGTGGGISNYQIGISNDDGATRFVSVRSSDNTISTAAVINNNYVVSSTIPNLHSSADGSRRVYRFTPPSIPNAPTAQAYTAIQCNQVRLNWTDNASNEVQYEIYQATNPAGPYTYNSRVAANSNNTTIYNLLANTNYYFRIRAVTEGTASNYVDLGLVTTLAVCGICETKQDGDWDQATTWLCGHVPYTYEDAIVKHNVRIDADMWGVNNVTIQNTGYLYFDAANSLDFQIYGDLTIDAGGRFHSAANNSSIVYLYGNMIVNGEYDGNRGTNGTDFRFQGIDNKTISGNDATICDFYTLTINKSSVKDATIEVQRVITLRQPSANGQTLQLSNGTFKLSSASVLSPYFGNLTVCGATSKLWLNHAAAVIKRVAANTEQMYIWDFQIDAGTFTNSGGTNFYSETLINNGTLQDLSNSITINGKLTLNNGTISCTSISDNGEIYINGGSLTTTTGGYLVENYNKGISQINAGTVTIATDFDIENKLVISGGTINVGDELFVDHNGTDEYGYLDFSNATMNVAARVQVTDFGTLKMNSGTINSGNGDDDFNIQQGAELIVNGGTINHYGRLLFDNGTLAAQSKFTMSAGNINIDPQYTSNLGRNHVVYFSDNTIVNFTSGILTIIDPNANNNRIDESELRIVSTLANKNFMGSTFIFGDGSSNSAGNAGSGGFSISTSAGVILDNVIFNNAPLPVVVTNRNLRLTSHQSATTNITNLTISNSNFNINGNTLNISGNLVNNGNINGTTASSHLKFVGSNAQTYSGTGSLTANLVQLTFNNTSATGVTLTSPIGATTVNLTDGNVYNDASSILTVHGTNAATSLVGGSSTNYVVGVLQRAIPNNAVNSNYNFPVGKTAYQLLEMFGITTSGAGTGYITAEYFEAATTGIGGTGIKNTPFNADNGYYKIDNNLNLVSLNLVSYIRLTKSVSTPPAKVIAQSNNTHIGGTYNSIGGTIVGGTITSDSYELTGINPTGTAYIIVAEVDPLTGTYYVGNPTASPNPARTFLNLNAVAQILREKVVDSNVFFELLDSYDDDTEDDVYPLPITFDVLTTTDANYTVTIRPQAGVVGTVTEQDGANADESLIIIDGISKLRFDGRPGGAGASDWTISNTRAASPGAAIEFRNGANDNQLNYLTIKSSNNNALNGVVYFGKSTAAVGNNNNTIQYCTITGYTTSPRHAIYSNGTSGKVNTANQISNNNFKDIFLGNQNTRVIYLQDFSSGWTISDNKIYHTTAKVFTAGNIFYAISVTNGNGHTIDANIIGYADEIQTATSYMQISGSTGRFIGIHTNTSTGTFTNLTNNIFSNIKFSTASLDKTNGIFNPLYIEGGDVNIGTAGNGNIIGTTGNFTDYPIEITYNAGDGQVIGIFCSAARPLNFTDNQIGGIKLIGNFDMWFVGIQTNGDNAAANFTIAGNIVGSTTKTNSILVGDIANNTKKNIYGIWAYECNTSVISNNIIANITGQTTSTGDANCNIGILAERAPYTVIGNQIFNLTHSTGTTDDDRHASLNGITLNSNEATPYIIRNNIIYGLENNNVAGNRSVKIVGIYIDNDNIAYPTNIVNGNFVHSFKINSSDVTSAMCGILIDDGNHEVANNMVRLGIDKDGNNITSSHLIYGINFKGDHLANFYHNSIYIGGTGVVGIAKTYAFYKRETKISNINNNIFVNNRSNGAGTGKHYAYALTFDDAINTNYNIYNATGTGGYLAIYDVICEFSSLREMQAYSNYKDLQSGVGNPNFMNPTGNATNVNLHLNSPTPAERMGTNIASITTDYDNENRNTFSPTDIGADANDFVFNASVDIFAPTFTYTPIEPQSCGVFPIAVSINVTIVEQGLGISNIAGSRPRVWYRNKTDLTAWTSTEGTLTSGDVFNGVWQFTLTGLDNGKFYEYYFVAEDVATIPNIGYSKFSATAPVHTNVTTQTTAPDATVDIDVFTVCVYPKETYHVGNFIDCTTCDFETLTAYGDFFFNMNAMLINKNVTCLIVANTQEPATYAAEDFTDVGTGSQTITIKPHNATLKTLTSDNTINQAEIRFEGAKRYIIDGQFNNDGNRWLNFIHQKNDQPVFQLKNDAQNDTVKYCIIESSPELNPSGVIFFDVALTSGNSNNVFDNNIITKKSTNPLNLIYSYGNNAFPNSNNTITNNIISNFRQYSIWVTSTGNGGGWNISNNIIYNQVNTDTLQNAIRIEKGAGHTISSNSIGGNAADNSGTWTNGGGSEFQTIYLDVQNTSKTIVSNNTIQNILLSNTSWTGVSRAIRAINNSWVDITDNTIQNIERRGRTNFYVISYSTTEPTEISRNTIRNITNTNANETDLYAIYLNTDDADINTVNDNTIAGINQISTSENSDFWGIYINNGIVNVNDNDLGGVNPADKIIITGGNFEGISFYNDDTEHHITGNTITNVELAGAKTFRGFYLYDMQDITLFNMQNNIIDNIKLTNAGASTFYGYDLRDGKINFNNNICGTAALGIANAGTGVTYAVYFYLGTEANSIINNNKIQKISGNGTTYAIYSNINVTHTISNNIISEINIANNIGFVGIRKNDGTVTMQNNLINNINLSNTGANTSFQGIWASGGSYTITSNTLTNVSVAGTSASNIINITSNQAGTFDVNNNLIQNIASSGNTILRGINMNVGATSILNVDNNRIYNLKNTNSGGANAYLTGIELFNNGKANITNNQIGNPLVANDISHSGNGYLNGIYVNTSTANTIAAYTTISNNTLSNFTMYGNSDLYGINMQQGGTGPSNVITFNNLNNFKSSNSGTFSRIIGIYASSSNAASYQVNVNNISNFTQNSNSQMQLIYVSTNAYNQYILGNNISNITMTTPYELFGISISSNDNNLPCYLAGNIIDNVNHTGGGDFSGIRLSKGKIVVAPLSTYTKNIIRNITTSGVLTIGIDVATMGDSYVENSIIENINATNSTSNSVLCGIVLSDIGDHLITKNIIRNLTTSSTNTSLTGFSIALAGIYANGGNYVIDKNEISTLIGNGNDATHLAGFAEQQSSVLFTRNKIWNIVNNSSVAGKTVTGILITTQNFGYSANNMISIGANDNTEYHGIWLAVDNVNTKNIYFNNIYIGGTATGGDSYAFTRKNNEVPINIKNNIFANFRTGGTGNHYAIEINNINAVTDANINANAYYSVDPATLGKWNNTNVNFKTWITNTNEDYDFLSTNQQPTYTAPTICDLHIDRSDACGFNSVGIPIAGITDDYDGNSRHANHPDIGAEEFSPTAHVGTFIWRGWNTNNWDTNTNWQCEIAPSNNPGELVVIANNGQDAIIQRLTPITTVIMDELEIFEDALLQVNRGNSLTLTGNFINNGTLKLKSPNSEGVASGSFIDNGNIINNGTFIAERFINAEQWHQIAAPTDNALSTLFTVNATGYYNGNLYTYNETIDLDQNNATNPTGAGSFDSQELVPGWTFVQPVATSPVVTLTPNKGYMYFNNIDKLINFTGNPNTGNFNIASLTWTNNDPRAGAVPELYDGWHLIGNPYPSSLDWNEMKDEIVGIDDGIYVWDNTGYSGYKNGSQVMLGNLTNLIPPAQGFFVHANTNNATINIRNEHRKHGTPEYLKTKDEKQNYLKIKTSANGWNDYFITHFEEDATTEYDGKYDMLRLFSQDATIPQLYSQSLISKDPLVLNCLPTELIYNFSDTLGLMLGINGSYKFEIEEINGFQNTSVVLEDRLTNTFIDLKKTSGYEFDFEAGNTKDRFIVHYGNITVDIENDNNQNSNLDIDIYPNPTTGKIFLKNNFQNLTYDIEIIDMTGKVYYTQSQINSNSLDIDLNNLTNGIYFVKIITQNNIFTEKIIVY